MPKQKFIVRNSRIEGMGAFATERIRKGERVIEYTGEVISAEEGDRRYSEGKLSEGPILLFTIDRGRVIDANVNGNDAKYINHSCDPNCESAGQGAHIYIQAIRTIYPGEELVYDYSLTREPGDDPSEYVCHCGAPNCRGTMLVARPKRTRKKAKAKTNPSASKKRKLSKRRTR
jgi:SET domain-containing protein